MAGENNLNEIENKEPQINVDVPEETQVNQVPPVETQPTVATNTPPVAENQVPDNANTAPAQTETAWVNPKLEKLRKKYPLRLTFDKGAYAKIFSKEKEFDRPNGIAELAEEDETELESDYEIKGTVYQINENKTIR